MMTMEVVLGTAAASGPGSSGMYLRVVSTPVQCKQLVHWS